MILTNLKLLQDDKIIDDRKYICQSCSYFTVIKLCEKCGCIMPVKWKFEYAKCPAEKW